MRDIRLIPLIGKNGRGKHAIVSAEDYPALSRYRWCTNGKYVVRKGIRRDGSRGLVYMHRQILGEPDSQCDHINHNNLDNRRENLRVCSAAQNNMNRRSFRNSTSRYVGVSRSRNKWRADVKRNGKQVCLGTFDTEEEAAIMRDKAAIKSYGEFANLNILPHPRRAARRKPTNGEPK